MSERSVIQQTIMPVTKAVLKEHFNQLGLTSTDVVIVHASLSKLGYVIGGAVTVIQALQEVLSEGTIIMPTQTGDNSNPEEWSDPAVPSSWFSLIKDHTPAFDPLVTPTRDMGVIPETFRSMPSVVRSNHPIDSFAVWGKDAKQIASAQELTPALGDSSPLGYLIANQGKVMLIGVGYDSCTLLHHAETKLPSYPTKNYQTAMLQDGQREWTTYQDFDYDPNDSFQTLGDSFEQIHTLQIRTVGLASVRVIDAPALDAFAVDYLRQHRS